MKDTTRLKGLGSAKGEGGLPTLLGPGFIWVQGPNSQESIWTHLKQIESLSWTLPWTPSLHLGSPNHELSLSFKSFLFWSKLIDFTSKMMSCMSLALICHFLVWDPHLKTKGSIYGSQPIGLLYLIGHWTFI
jgi:hypothetical protein